VQPLIQTIFSERNGDISPDGRWMAYQSNESGQYQIYVRPFPKVDDGRWQVSTAGGTRPLWSRDGRELFYLDDRDRLTVVRVQVTARTFTASTPSQVLATPYYAGSAVGRTYDGSPDGQRFLMIKDDKSMQDPDAAPPSLTVVVNWVEELKRLVPAR
jgi:serine/threonine-protein kinase